MREKGSDRLGFSTVGGEFGVEIAPFWCLRNNDAMSIFLGEIY